jgi:hypothetical protein
MSRYAAIDIAVRLQLAQDGSEHYNDFGYVMGSSIAAQGAQAAISGYNYDEARLTVFLQKIARRLKFDTPSLNFDWTKTPPAIFMRANRDTVIELIAGATDSAKKE